MRERQERFLESGDGEGFLNIVSDRLDNIERLGGDPSQNDECA